VLPPHREHQAAMTSRRPKWQYFFRPILRKNMLFYTKWFKVDHKFEVDTWCGFCA